MGTSRGTRERSDSPDVLRSTIRRRENQPEVQEHIQSAVSGRLLLRLDWSPRGQMKLLLQARPGHGNPLMSEQ